MTSQPAIQQMRLVFQWLLVLSLLICVTNPVSTVTAAGQPLAGAIVVAADSPPGFWPDAGNLAATYSTRALHSVVWTGTEMIIWGGSDGVSGIVNTGGRYNPVTDTWTEISTTNAPDARASHTAVWTGTEMLIWGGTDGPNFLNTGGRYNPVTDTWTEISTTNAPNNRLYHSAVWTGTEMLIWGGTTRESGVVNTGGRYNPATDAWTSISTTNAPDARAGHTALWTGTEMLIWGGSNGANYFNTGGRYNPAAPDDVAWAPITTTNAPIARGYHTAVWTGTEMIVWGGMDSSTFFNTGGRYNPTHATWLPAPTAITNAPDGRYNHQAVWTGTEMIVWGGISGDMVSPMTPNIGGRYNPAAPDDVAWTSTSTTNAPAGRYYHSLVWTGTGMIVWGGFNGSEVFGAGGRYHPSNTVPTISGISDQTTIIDTPFLDIPFTVGDQETGAFTLTLNAISSNPVLVPDENILLEGSGPNRTITISPIAGKTGATTITITVSDGVNTGTGSFVLTVNPHRIWAPFIAMQP